MGWISEIIQMEKLLLQKMNRMTLLKNYIKYKPTKLPVNHNLIYSKIIKLMIFNNKSTIKT
jgi:hypothetical protein